MKTLKSNLFILVLLVYFSNIFISYEYNDVLLSVLAFLLLLVTIPGSKSVTQIMGISLLVLGIAVSLFMNSADLLETVQGIQLNLPLLILILMAPLLSIPLKTGTYLEAPMAYIEQVKAKPKQLFLSISGFLTLLTPILNVGSVRILDDLMRNRNLSSELLGRSYFTGFSTAMVWSPYFGSVALVLYYLDIPYSEYFIIGIIFAGAQLLTGNLLFAVRNRKVDFNTPSEDEEEREKVSIVPLVIKFIVSLGIFIVTLIFLESWTKLPMLVLVSMLSLIIPAIWMLLAGKWKIFIEQVLVYKNQVTQGSGNEIVLFLSAGLFGSAISNSSISNLISNGLMQISEISFFFFVIFIVVTIMFFALIGFHQIITIPILVMQIEPAALGVDPIVVAFVFIMAWFMSAIISPINAITILITNSLNKKFFTVSFRWNGLYVLSMFLVGSVFIYTLRIIYQ